MNEPAVPNFRPCLGMRCGHRQTVLGNLLPGGRFPHVARSHQLSLRDGDLLVVHDDMPADWKPQGPVAVLVHGLGGDHRSGYMVRIAAKLKQRGVRVFRMDQRGCGAAAFLSTRTAHAGRSDDIADLLDWVTSCCPGSKVSLVGFSLGGNAVLKLAGETGSSIPWQLKLVIAVAPPINLEYCAVQLSRPRRRFYDRRFVRQLCRQVRNRCQQMPAAEDLPSGMRPRSVFEFDDCYTSQVNGFRDAVDYYDQSSAGSRLDSISIETRILVAEDDPVVPIEIFDDISYPDCLRLLKTEHGGHLGYLGVKGVDRDRRWMDWRIVDWVISSVTG